MAAKIYVTAEQISALTRGYSVKAKEIYMAFVNHPDVLQKYGFTTPTRIAAILATALAEMGSTEIRENMNYSASRILQVWPSRPQAARYAHNPRMLANSVYGTRMGNRAGTDDGYNFRGGGMVQTTGRAAYQHMEEITGLPLSTNPDLIEEPRTALIALCAESAQFMRYADLGVDGFRAFSNGINRGNAHSSQAPIGWTNRLAQYRRVMRALGDQKTPRHLTGEAATIGMSGADIADAQQRLAALGYKMVGPADGVLGPSTRAALLAFQAENHMSRTGTLTSDTVACLFGATAKPMPVGDAARETAADLAARGSRIVRGADQLRDIGAGTAAIGALTAVGKAVGSASEALDTVDSTRSLLDRAIDAAAWCADKWYIVAILLGAYVVYRAVLIIRARVEDHNNGTHAGR